MNAPVPRERLERFAALVGEARKREDRKKQSGRGGLLEFIRYFWHVLEPNTPLVDGKALEAICLHLEAVTFGEITRLLINVPPGFMKSLICDVFWPAWEWGPMNKAHHRFVAFSYAASLTLRDNGRFRDLIISHQYQELWSHRFTARKIGEEKVSNDKTGWKLASSVGGVATGERGNRVVLDDPHSVKEAESDVVRSETVRWFKEAMSNRLNDMERDAIIVIMQRVHENDVSGAIIAGEMGYVHLCIPMEYDEGRHCETEIGWSDWRTTDGELAWPERFSANVIAGMRRDLGSYAYSGQYQQSPVPRGGGIFKTSWWNRWDDESCRQHGVPEGHLPSFSYILGILDSAYTKNEENDPCAMTVWGLWHDLAGNPAVMLVNAWEEWLEFAPLVARSAKACTDFRVDRLLIESKASGISVAQELARQYSQANWGIELVNPGRDDKIARAYAVTHLFEAGMVWAPGFTDGTWRRWAERVIDQMSAFPKAPHDDLTDTGTMGLKYLRDTGMLLRREEHARNISEQLAYRPKEKPLY